MIRLIFTSVIEYIHLLFSGSLYLAHTRIGQTYEVKQQSYSIFRETVSNKTIDEKPVILIVGFRLKFLRSIPIFHWVFQRVCIFTTPFWSGFRGFRIKLWMVDQNTKDYLGIYEWEGEQHARTYVTTLSKILHPLSVNHSVWYEIITDQLFEKYLEAHHKYSAV